MTYEDFTTYTEVEPDNRIQKTAQHIDILAERNEDSYVYKDKGVDFFGDFEHLIDFYIDAVETYGIISVWGVTQDVDDFCGLRTASKTFLQANVYKETTNLIIRFYEEHLGSNYRDDTFTISLDTWYYLTITKSGTSWVCKIYSDSDRTDLLATRSLTLQADHKFRYIYPCSSWNSDHTGRSTTADIEKLDLQEAPPPDPPTVTTQDATDIGLQAGHGESSPTTSLFGSYELTTPRGFHYEGTYHRTYFTGLDKEDNKIWVNYYDHNLTAFGTRVNIITPAEIDCHDVASILVDHEGYIHVVGGSHRYIPGYAKYRRTSDPEDISSWETEKQIGTKPTYECIREVLVGGSYYIYVFYRGSNAALDAYECFVKSANSGVNWDSQVIFADFTTDWDHLYHGDYFIGPQTPTNYIYMCFCLTAEGATDRYNIYFGYSDDGGTTWRKADGTSLGSQMDETHCELVYEGGGEDPNQCCAWDIKVDSSNRPIILFTDSHVIKIAKWNGSSWDIITSSLYATFPAKLEVLSDTNWKVYYANVDHVICVGETINSGADWDETLLCGVETEHFSRPMPISNYDSRFKLIFQDRIPGQPSGNEYGDYVYGTDFPLAYATLHGTITDTGGENPSQRGFDWDYDSGEPYAYSWTESGSYGVGAFNHQITELTPGVTVYFRAKAVNTGGWGYGTEKSFVTPTPVIQKGFSENGLGTEIFGTPFKTLPFSEIGGGAETFGIPLKGMKSIDVGSGIEVFQTPYKNVGFSDQGLGSEAFQVPYKSIGFSDEGLGSEVFGVFQNKYFADVGGGTDIFSKIITFLKKQFSDVGSGIDTFETPYREMGFIEVGYGSDAFVNITLKFFVDTGNGVEVFEIPFQFKDFSDLGDGADVFNIPYRGVGFSDTGLGTDIFSKIVTFLNVVFSDSGYGDDLFEKITILQKVQFSDSGLGVDAFEILHKELGFVDAGQGTDTFVKFVMAFFVDVASAVDIFETAFRTMKFLETGEGTDTFNTFYREMGFSDIGEAIDVFSKILAGKDVDFSDVGSGAEVFSIPHKTIGFSDVGIGTDVFKVFLNQLNFPDTGQGLDVFVTAYRQMGFVDSGSGADVFSIIFKALGFSDVGSGVEVFVIPLKGMVFSDSGLGSDVFGVNVFKYFVDAGSGTEVFEKEVYGLIDKFFYETGLGTDTFAIVFKTKPFVDSGLGVDSFVTPYREMEFTEEGSGTDVFVVILSKNFSDTGYGAELFQKQIFGLVPKDFSDSGLGSDVFVILFKGKRFVDSGSGIDNFVTPYRELGFGETGLGLDNFAIILKAIGFPDSGLGTDVFATPYREMDFDEVGQGVEIFSKIVTFLKTNFSDLGTGTDTFVNLYREVKFNELGSGIDNFVVSYRELDFDEVAMGEDIFALIFKTTDFSDLGLGTDSFETPYRQMFFVDTGHGAEIFSKILTLKLVDFPELGIGTDVFIIPYKEFSFEDLGKGVDTFPLFRPQAFFDLGLGSDIFVAFRPFWGLLIGTPEILGIEGKTETFGIKGTINIIPKEGLK